MNYIILLNLVDNMKIVNFFNPFLISDKQLYSKTLLIFCLTISGGIFALNGDFNSSKNITPGLYRTHLVSL